MNNWVEPGWNSKKTNYILSQGYKNYREPFTNSDDATTLIQTDANKLFDAYCGSEGTLNPAKTNTGYMELSHVYNITDGSPETKRAAVSDYIKNTYETAINVNLDINKGDSEGGRKTSFNKCFGVNINEVPTQSSYSGTMGSSLTAAPGITPQNISLSLLQYFFEQAGCSRTLNENDVWWWRGRANIQDIKNDMNAYGSLTANCSGDMRQHEFCKPGKCPVGELIATVHEHCDKSGWSREIRKEGDLYKDIDFPGNISFIDIKIPCIMVLTNNGWGSTTVYGPRPVSLCDIGGFNDNVMKINIKKQCINPPMITTTKNGVTLTAPSCVNKGVHFTANATGNLGAQRPWYLEVGSTTTQNTGCVHPGGCGWYAPNTPGKITVIHQNSQARLDINVI